MLKALIQETALCSHFGRCGGCRYQNISYDDQLAQKEAQLFSLFDALGGEFHPILGCYPPWRYRNRMDFTFFQKKSGEKTLGFSERGRRWGGVDLHECLLTGPWMMEVLEVVRGWWQESGLFAYHALSNQGTLRTLTLREGIYTGEKMAVLIVSGDADSTLTDGQKGEFVERLLSVVPLSAVIIRRHIIARKVPTRFEDEVIYGKDHIHEILHDGEGRQWKFKVGSQSFFQPNTKQAEVIYQQALAYAELSKEDRLLDLYCGAGGFGILASPYVSHVLGIELSEESVRNAGENLRLNQVSNMEVCQGDVGAVLAAHQDFASTVLLVDPPRAGLSKKALEHVLELGVGRIVYVSCNPATQASDCRQLIEGGYRIQYIQPVDQFPHTPHVENIVTLRR